MLALTSADIGRSYFFRILSMADVGADKEKLNQVRERLFEELVRTRKEAASTRVELEEAIKARGSAEAELARLKQEMTEAKPADQPPASQADAQPQKQAPEITSALHGSAQRPVHRSRMSKRGLVLSNRGLQLRPRRQSGRYRSVTS
ncbi:hypothetical protein AA309_19200 [Microvirga vignae]|uniref:Uncharacterized protein n=1 Tax=Microvirga vignae TaxID=1225564 RepID=A0A0H1R8Z4_9HYPH|nr:hypothetical protein [Microvirga vignae]KLK91529.1 hypothetical protein AA309_19200 [Microvirga vignae]